MVAGRPSAAACRTRHSCLSASQRQTQPDRQECLSHKEFLKFWEGRIEVGKTPRCSLPPVPPGRAETVFERPALLYGEVRDRKTQLRAGAARAIAAPEGRWIRPAIARETEGQALLRAAGAAIPQLL